jgi:ankyrin repeat protein
VNAERRSALHFAAAMGKAPLVERLLKAGAEVDLGDKEGAWSAAVQPG